MNVRGASGRPGPLLRFGVPALFIAILGYWVYPRVRQVLRPPVATSLHADAPGIAKSAAHLRLASDGWSGSAALREEPRFHAALAREGFTLENLPPEEIVKAGGAAAALSTGLADAAVLSLDAFVNLSAQSSNNAIPAVVFLLDESSGADAIYLGRDRADLSALRSNDKVCFAESSRSEYLWDFATLSLEALKVELTRQPAPSAAECWTQLQSGAVQVAVLSAPFTALAERAGFTRILATGPAADDLVIDAFVVARPFLEQNLETIQRVTAIYFAAVANYQRTKAEFAAFLARACGQPCKDLTLGESILSGVDVLDFEENACIWFGACAEASRLDTSAFASGGGKLPARLEKTHKLLAAKRQLRAALPAYSQLVDVRPLAYVASQHQAATNLAREVGGTSLPSPATRSPEEAGTQFALGRKPNPDKIGALTLPTIAFAHASYQLDETAQSTLVSVAEKLRSFPHMCIRILGFSTRREDADPNHRLSKLRGSAIAQELTRLDPAAFPPERFDVRALGSGNDPSDKDAERKPRRTEFALFTCATK